MNLPDHNVSDLLCSSGIRAGLPRNRGSIPGKGKRYPPAPDVPNDSGVHSATYSILQGGRISARKSSRGLNLTTHLQLIAS